MAKSYSQYSGLNKAAAVIFFGFVVLSLLAPLWVFKDLLFPYVTSKAFYFRICLELALPFYVYLLLVRPELRPKFKGQYLNWFVLLFLLINIISSFTGVATVRSLWGNFERMGGAYYIAHLTLLYFYGLMLAQLGGKYFKLFLQGLLLSAAIVTVNGIFGKLGLPTLVQDPSLPARVSSTLGNPIYVGSFLVIPVFLAGFFAVQAEQTWKRVVYAVLSLMFLLGVFLSGTRGALVGLVGGIFLAAVVYIILTKNKLVKIWGSVLAGIFAVAAGLLFIMSGHFAPGSLPRRIFSLDDSSSKSRLIQWGVALKGYKDHPFFGVGPENYYVIANKYYNPEIFNYDRSWFDKPHNYLLEILVTDGAFGFLSYLGILIFMGWGFYKGYKGGFLNLMEFCLLLAALLVYQIQNLTVFDTVAASLAFYSLLALAGFLWDSGAQDANGAKKSSNNNRRGADPLLPGAAFGVCLVVAVYLVYVTNIIPMEVGKAVNYGYAYASVDVTTADAYFQRAVTLPFNFDKTQTAEKYMEFTIGLERGGQSGQQALITKISNEAIAAANDALAVEPTYPILWQELSEVYLFQNVQNGQVTSVNPLAVTSINRAIALAPGREEPLETLAEIQASEGDWADAIKTLDGLIAEFPSDNTLLVQKANFLRLEGKTADAAVLVAQAQAEGYTFSSFSDMSWLVSYYYNQKDYNQALALLQQGAKLEPNNLDVQVALAQLYAVTGQGTQALSLAEAILQADPSRASSVQPIINQFQPKSGK